MLEVSQRGQALVDDLVARQTGEGRHECHPAGVVFVARVVEPLSSRLVAHGRSRRRFWRRVRGTALALRGWGDCQTGRVS